MFTGGNPSKIILHNSMWVKIDQIQIQKWKRDFKIYTRDPAADCGFAFID